MDEGDVDGLLTIKLLGDLDRLRAQAQNALVLAGDHHRWRGRTIFYWLKAITLLITASIASLQGEGGSYIREKFLAVLRALGDGVSETIGHGPLASELTAWPTVSATRAWMRS